MNAQSASDDSSVFYGFVYRVVKDNKLMEDLLGLRNFLMNKCLSHHVVKCRPIVNV